MAAWRLFVILNTQYHLLKSHLKSFFSFRSFVRFFFFVQWFSVRSTRQSLRFVFRFFFSHFSSAVDHFLVFFSSLVRLFRYAVDSRFFLSFFLIFFFTSFLVSEIPKTQRFSTWPFRHIAKRQTAIACILQSSDDCSLVFCFASFIIINARSLSNVLCVSFSHHMASHLVFIICACYLFCSNWICQRIEITTNSLACLVSISFLTSKISGDRDERNDKRAK